MPLYKSFIAHVLIAWLGLAASSQSVAAKNLALLIGVSNYELATITKLKAPGNDVRLVWDALRERGFDRKDMVVLADNLAPGKEAPIRVLRPTKKNILEQLDALAAKAGDGDIVVVYYSGHGTYMRQSTPKIGEVIERTGNNQVLLAIDARKFDPIKGEIKGGIVDKTLKRKFDAIKEKRAFLWLILDSCHSGGLTRDKKIGVTVHFVDPEVLGLPTASPGAAKRPETHYSNPWINQQVGNKQVAFLAAPEEYPAYEKEIGVGGRHYALFTYTLVTTLRGENFSSYRQFARAVLRAQAGLSGNVPAPVFEGDLDQPMFDGAAVGARSWLAEADPEKAEVRINAGALHGVRAGTIVSFERDRHVLGYAEVLTADVSISRARPIAFKGHPVPNSSDLAGRLSAKIVKPAVSFALKVARPPDNDRRQTESSRNGFSAIEKLSTEPNSTLPIEWTKPRDASADLHLRVLGGVIYLVRATAELVREGRNRTPAVRISANAKATADDLKENLWRVLRQLNLRRIASEMRDEALSEAVEVKLKLIRDTTELKKLSANEKQACKSWDKPPESLAQRSIVPGQGSGIRLTHCDQVAVEIVNRWPKPVDVTLLYLDSEAGIGALPAGQARIPANQAHRPHKFPPIRIITWCDARKWKLCKGRAPREFEPVGSERLLVIIAEGNEASQDRRTFEYLAQPTLAKAEEIDQFRPRSSADSFDDLLRGAALIPNGIRGKVDRAGDATVKIFPWEVVPPNQIVRVN